MQRGFSIAVAALVVFGGALAAQQADTPAIHIRNFSQVNDHLYRGAQPTADGIRQLAAAHVSLVIDLREPSPGTEAERKLVESLGMKYTDIPLPRLSAPPAEKLVTVLSLLQDKDRVFVHCWRGKDRTGTVIACYRMQHDGWTPQRALDEAAQKGMSEVQRSMRGFILRFQPENFPLPPVLTKPAAGNRG